MTEQFRDIGALVRHITAMRKLIKNLRKKGIELGSDTRRSFIKRSYPKLRPHEVDYIFNNLDNLRKDT